jgi:hypothetical protein
MDTAVPVIMAGVVDIETDGRNYGINSR